MLASVMCLLLLLLTYNDIKTFLVWCQTWCKHFWDQDQFGFKYIPPARQDNCVDCRESQGSTKARLFFDKRPCCPVPVPPTNLPTPTVPTIPTTPGCPRNLGVYEDKGKSGSGNFTNGRDHLGVIVLTSYDVYLLGQAFLYYEVDPDCYVYVCYGASCSQGLTYTIHCRDLWRLNPAYIYCATIVFSSTSKRQNDFCREDNDKKRIFFLKHF